MTVNRDSRLGWTTRTGVLRALAAGAATLWGGAAAAQEPFTIETFEPTSSAHGALGVDAASVPTHLAPYFDATVHRADRSVVFRGDELIEGIDDRWIVDLGAGIGLFDTLQLDLRLPLLAAQSGVGIDGVFARIAAGDLRMRAKWRLLERDEDNPFGLALQGALYLPTGDPEAFLTNGAARVEPRLVFDVRLGRVLLLANVGYQARPRRDIGLYRHGNVIRWGIASSVDLVGGFGLELSAIGEHPGFSDGLTGETMGHVSAHPIEALAGIRWTRAGFHTSLAGGLGITHGVGAPAYRLLWSVGFAPAAVGRSREVVPPYEPFEPAHCTTCDDDQDGVPNEDDLCPEVAGIASKAGCPAADIDEDGLDDADDACPTVPGTAQNDGCPDDDDAAQWRARALVTASCDPGAQACEGPSHDVEEVLQDTIAFPVAIDHFRPEDFPLLDELAERMQRESSIIKLIIEGHADSIGAKEYNLELSRGRAAAVYRVLVRRGIDPSRLEMVAYGEDQPIATNETVEGRQRNRRVAFRVLTRRGMNAEPTPTLSIADFDFDRRMLVGFHPARFIEGTVLRTPEGWSCSVDGGESADELTLVTSGAPHVQGLAYPGWTTDRTLTCRSGPNVVVFNVEVEIPPFAVRTATQRGIVVSNAEPTYFDVRFAGRAVPLDVAIDGYDSRQQVVSADLLRMRLQREGDQPVSSARVGMSERTLLEVPLTEIRRTFTVDAPDSSPDRGEFFAGAVFLRGGEALEPDGGLLAGMRVGVQGLATDWFSAGFYADVAATLTRGPVYYLTPGIGAAATFHVPTRVFRPFASAGVQVSIPGVFLASQPSFEGSAGFDISPDGRSGVRISARGVLLTHDGNFVVLPGAFLGAFSSF